MENLKEKELELARNILELNMDIEDGFNNWEKGQESSRVILEKFSQLLALSEDLKASDPEFYKDFEKNNFNGKGLLQSLDVLNEDIREGLGKALENMSANKEETVISLAEHIKSNAHHAWQNRNPTSKLAQVLKSYNEEAKINKLLNEFLPSVKAEEMSDLLGLAVSGKLSENYESISNLPSIDAKVIFVKQLIAKEKLYINVKFDTLTVMDQTFDKRIDFANGSFGGRKTASQSMLDSAFLNTANNELVVVCATANKDTYSQKDQVFKIFHTLNKKRELKELSIGEAENPNVNILLYNNALFCTQEKSEVSSVISAGRKGGLKEIEGFHHASNRAEFEKLIPEGVVISKAEMDKINGLVTLSMIGNDLNYPRVPYTFELSDLVNANPFTVGADTLWLKNKFEEIKEFTGKEREQKFFEFLVSYTAEVTETLVKLKSSMEVSSDNVQIPLLKNITDSLNRTIEGMANGFSTYNLGQDYVDGLEGTETYEKVKNLKSLAKDFNKKHPNVKLKTTLIDNLKDSEKLSDLGEEVFANVEFATKKFCENWNNSELKSGSSKCRNITDVICDFSMGVLGSDEKNKNVQALHERLDNAIKHLYSTDNALNRKDRKPVHHYLYASMFKTFIESSSNSQDKNVLDFKSGANNIYGNVNDILRPSSLKRKVFQGRVDEAEIQNPGSSQGLIEADKIFTTMMFKLSNEFGSMKVIENGGYELALSEMVVAIEDTLGLTSNRKVKLGN